MDPTILWLRRDLRLADHPALNAAIESNGPVIPVFILSPDFEAMGAAPRWRLAQALQVLAERLAGRGSKLLLRRGDPAVVLDDLIAETGARAVYWSRLYDRPSRERDSGIKSALSDKGVVAKSFASALLFEPWTVETGQGGPYRVYSPFWRAVAERDVASPLAEPSLIPAPDVWPGSDKLENWDLQSGVDRGGRVLQNHCQPGDVAAQDRLEAFLDSGIDRYRTRRDFLADDATSGMSEYLTWGEISPVRLWHAAQALQEAGSPGAEHFRKEVVWREFAWHLMYHYPDLAEHSWREGWETFPWRPDNEDAEAWRRGKTGIHIVDAAMRQMYVTGRMHNRARMIVASFLTKHLLTDWRVGRAWFEDCLTDWDPASNAMGWQWVAGSGPDAAPYFRVFNPETQAAKFDPDGRYRRRWLSEGETSPSEVALSYFEAIPRSWGLSPKDPVPPAIVELAAGRERALGAYEFMRNRNSFA